MVRSGRFALCELRNQQVADETKSSKLSAEIWVGFCHVMNLLSLASSRMRRQGATIEVELGGRHDDLHGKPIVATARVESLTDGKVTLTAWAPGWEIEYGPSARLIVDDVDVIVVSAQSQVFDPEIFRIHGIDVTTRDIVALKSSAHFRAGFRSLAKEIITADTPGVTTTHVEDFQRARMSVPLWPVDPAAAYPPVP
jgi:microcystin degradation protein MlrC